MSNSACQQQSILLLIQLASKLDKQWAIMVWQKMILFTIWILWLNQIRSSSQTSVLWWVRQCKNLYDLDHVINFSKNH